MELMQRYGATHLHIAAPVGVILAKAPFVAEYDFSTVRAATSGGAPLGWAVIEMVWKRLGFLIRMGYGTSEHAGSTQTYHLTWDKLGAAKTASGQPMYGTEVKIMSVDHEKKSKNSPTSGGQINTLILRDSACYWPGGRDLHSKRKLDELLPRQSGSYCRIYDGRRME